MRWGKYREGGGGMGFGRDGGVKGKLLLNDYSDPIPVNEKCINFA